MFFIFLHLLSQCFDNMLVKKRPPIKIVQVVHTRKQNISYLIKFLTKDRNPSKTISECESVHNDADAEDVGIIMEIDNNSSNQDVQASKIHSHHRDIVKRTRKDSFRITQVLDHRITDEQTILEENDLDQLDHHSDHNLAAANHIPQSPLSRQNRIGSVDSNAHPIVRPNTMLTRSSSVHSHKKSNSQVSWKQLNDDLNHLFPCKKNSNPNLTINPQQLMPRPTSPSVTPTTPKGDPLRKSLSRTSLYNPEADLDQSDDEHYLHTIHGGGRTNTVTTSRHLEPFSKITRQKGNEDSQLPLSSASSCQNVDGAGEPASSWHHSMVANGVRLKNWHYFFSNNLSFSQKFWNANQCYQLFLHISANYLSGGLKLVTYCLVTLIIP